jgi:hypothetical protein
MNLEKAKELQFGGRSEYNTKSGFFFCLRCYTFVFLMHYD